MSNFIMDAHTHPPRIAPGLLKGGCQTVNGSRRRLEEAIMTQVVWDNSLTLWMDTDRLGIAMAP